MLASLAEDELGRRLDSVELARFTERTIVDIEALRLELGRIRARGFGEDNEEYVVGCRCIAMPIRARAGRCCRDVRFGAHTPVQPVRGPVDPGGASEGRRGARVTAR